MSESKTLEQTLLSFKDTLKPNTIKAYCTSLRSLSRNTGVELSPTEFKKNKNIIFKYLQTLDFKKRKHIIASLLLYLTDVKDKAFIDTLKNIMYEDIKLTDEEQKKQEKTPRQKANWMSWQEILDVRENLKNQVSHLFAKKNVNVMQYNKLIDYIIVCLYTYNPPRRLDYKDMRPFGYPVKDVKEDENYIDVKAKRFVFQNYKTKGTYDDQMVDINPELFAILKAFSKVKVPYDVSKEDEWLIYDTKGLKFNSSKLSQRISSIFNKPNFSTNMLRHIYISEKVLPDRERLTELEEKAREMGHSLETQSLYKKF